MKINFNKLMFYSTMTWGVIFSISSNSWMMIWIGLEISMMSIMPLMCNKNLLSSESSMKYFIVQSISSSLMMWGVLLMIINSKMTFQAILSMSLLMKMGVSPFHNWMMEIIEGLDYTMVFTLLTLMKLAPLNFMSYLSMKLSLFSFMSMVIGSMMGITQNSIRKILGYSSIFNMGFMLTSINKNSIWMSFMLTYSTTLLMTILLMTKYKMFYINQVMSNDSLTSKLNIWIIMLSLGGLPPMIGFMGKFMIIQTMMENMEMLISLTMILTSIFTMYFYMRISFVMIMFSSLLMKWKTIKLNKMSNLAMLINLLILPLTLTLKSFL
uniref:NADH dehydrogenase subunit 2 n=1 Tax=Nandigallia matai TaxID=1792639 RepID=UPI003002E4C8|nr:NADH dehydrogenase subunit 2 [Nandigallia matai]